MIDPELDMEYCDLEQLGCPEFPERVFRLADFAAAADDKTALQRAVDECRRQGGGTVRVDAGVWQTAALKLYGGIRLHLEEGSRLEFSPDPADYLPAVFTRWEGIECWNYSPLIYAVDGENIAITGKGVLYGNGPAWWHWKTLQQAAAKKVYDAEADGVPVEARRFGTVEAALRPSFIQFIRCRNVCWQDFTICDGPQWMLHPVYCENVLVRGVKVDSSGPNTDGLNPDSCTNVRIEDCFFSTGDDCIALNSGMNEDGWRVNRPCENVLIRRCRMVKGHGAVVIGSGMSGGVRHVRVQDCAFDGTELGIRLKSMRGRGGVVEDVSFDRIGLDHISGPAIQITTFYQATTIPPKSKVPPVFRNITIRNISGSGNHLGIEMKGLPDAPLENILLENVDLGADTAMECSDISCLTLNGVRIRADQP